MALTPPDSTTVTAICNWSASTSITMKLPAVDMCQGTEILHSCRNCCFPGRFSSILSLGRWIPCETDHLANCFGQKTTSSDRREPGTIGQKDITLKVCQKFSKMLQKHFEAPNSSTKCSKLPVVKLNRATVCRAFN